MIDPSIINLKERTKKHEEMVLINLLKSADRFKNLLFISPYNRKLAILHCLHHDGHITKEEFSLLLGAKNDTQ